MNHATPVRVELNLAAPIAQGTVIDVVVATQPGGFLGEDYTGAWVQEVETGIVYADAVFYRKRTAVLDHSAPASLDVRSDLTVRTQFRGRVLHCRVCGLYRGEASTTLLVQP